MNVRTLCLAILNIEDATGYEIKKMSLEGSFQCFVDISFGSIYPALAKLEQEGLVSCHAQPQDGKPDRKVYSITDEGRTEFIKLINVMPKPDKYKSEFLLLSINAALAERELLEQAINIQLEQYNNELGLITEVLGTCDVPAHLWTARYGQAVMEAKIKYLEENRDELLNMSRQPMAAQAAE